MTIHVINKVNSTSRFLYRQNKFLEILLRMLLCNEMIQTFFGYASNAWYLNLNKNLQLGQNTSIWFYLKLGLKKGITVKEFENTSWLLIKLGPHYGINLDKSLKASASLNVFKHEDYYFRQRYKKE